MQRDHPKKRTYGHDWPGVPLPLGFPGWSREAGDAGNAHHYWAVIPGALPLRYAMVEGMDMHDSRT
jgi:hypothetical protein